MKKVIKIYSKTDMKKLISKEGFRNAYKKIYLQTSMNQNKISSQDVYEIYDSYYVNYLDSNLIVKKVNGYNLSYFNLFAYNIIKSKKAKVMDVVEHLSQEELLKILDKSYSLLDKGGQVIIHTPNGLRSINIRKGITVLQWPLRIYYMFLKRFFKPYNYQDVLDAYYKQVHINIMTPLELESILKKVGFREVKFVFRDNKKGVISRIRKILKMSPDMGVIAKK